MVDEPPLDVFESIKCPACNHILKVAKSRTLKTRRETRIMMKCENCGAKFRLRWERLIEHS